MGRPPKKGLSYFPFDVDIFDDYKISDLLAEYGGNGFSIYIFVLTEVYRNGYYLEVPIAKLATKCVKQIGSRWVNKGFVLQVIRFCADIGLFDGALLSQGVITSAGIQQRYGEATVRSKAHRDKKYWLLDSEKDETSEALLKSPTTTEYATEKGVFATETEVFDAKTDRKKSKVNNIPLSKSDARKAYGDYCHVLLTQEERRQLDAAYGAEEAGKRVAMLDTWMEQHQDYRSDNHYLTITQGWVDRKIAEEKNAKPRTKKSQPGSQWKDFNQRSIDYDALMREISGAW